eukprot:scaffold19197_cov40-Cyclotella_meneghiniana.AAC.3
MGLCCRFSALIASTTLVDPTLSFLLHRYSNLTASRRNSLARKSSATRCNSSSSSRDDGVTLESVAESLKHGRFNQVLIVSGAGVSCSAGIPDFRTPDTTIFTNSIYHIQTDNSAICSCYTEAISDVDFYVKNPMPFVTLAKEIWPGVKYSLLDKKGLLKRVYTQNIDGLDAVAGVSPDRLVECHGHFRSATCVACQTKHDIDSCKSSMVENGEAPSCGVCGGVVKPDITFFGEVMPQRFAELIDDDCSSTDLVIVLGTSLMVAPVASIPDWVPSRCTRLLINRDVVGTFQLKNKNDVIMQGDCDEGVRKLCQMIGWEAELDHIYREVEVRM